MTEETNLTSVLYKKQQFGYEKRKIPEPNDGEVLLRIESVGLCGSDVHYWWQGRSGRFVVESPIVLGHESSATVVKCGPQVTSLKPGDRVAIEPGIPCRACSLCKKGRYNLCPDVRFCATPPVDGTLTQYYIHPHDFCVKLPPDVSNEEGALLEPLSVAVYSCRRAEVTFGSTVLILGAGPIGLVSLLTAKAMGASLVAITDINDKRLAVAVEMGCDVAINVAGRSPEVIAKEVEILMGKSPTAIIECSGADTSLKTGILAGAPRSIMVTVGRGFYDISIPLSTITIKEMEIRGIFRYANCYETALEMITSGLIDLKPLVTHRFSFEEVENAFYKAKDGTAIKVMIKVN